MVEEKTYAVVLCERYWVCGIESLNDWVVGSGKIDYIQQRPEKQQRTSRASDTTIRDPHGNMRRDERMIRFSSS
jgi:hypothetical protein